MTEMINPNSVVAARTLDRAGSLVALSGALQKDQISLPDYLDALQADFDSVEPTIQSFVPEPGRFERLRTRAQELVQRYPQPMQRPPLFGVPVGLKDIIYADGQPTRAGSRLPPEAFREPQGAVVTCLIKAGALILGKTVSAEFAYFAPGPTCNPLNPQHTPGGSSSGSAAAVSAGLVPLALGTQTIGSIIRPAAFCGIVGFKPSFDRLGIDGIVLVSPSADHLGLFTRDVSGMQFAASVLFDGWERSLSPARPVLGVPLGPYMDFASKAAINQFEAVVNALTAQGWQVREAETMSDFGAIADRHRDLVAAEAAIEHSTRFQEYGSLYHPKTVELIRRGMGISAERLAAAKQSRFDLRQELELAMQEHQIDLWITPATVDVAPAGLDSTGDPIMNLPWSHSGLPALTIPSGKTENGLTFGLQVIGRWFEDEKLLEWGVDLENSLKKGLT